MTNTQKPERITRIEEIISEVSGVSISDMYSRSRDPAPVDARFAVWYAAKMAGFSYMRIGRLYNRDHTTIMHGISKMKRTGSGTKVVATIKERHPGLLETPGRDEGKTVDKWAL